MLYLLNSPILTGYGVWRFEGPLTPEQARQRLEGQTYTSAIGHPASARLLQSLLGLPVALARITAKMQPGDSALVLRLLERQPEGVVLNDEQLLRVPYELSWLHYQNLEPVFNAERSIPVSS